MFKVSELNPKDTVLDEIHQIQQGIYAEEKNASAGEIVAKLHKVRTEFSKKYNCQPKVVSVTTTKH